MNPSGALGLQEPAQERGDQRNNDRPEDAYQRKPSITNSTPE